MAPSLSTPMARSLTKQAVFVNGTETFTYTISDGHGGISTATVAVTVNLPPTAGIDMLLAQVKGSSLGRGRQTSLIAKQNAAQQSLARHNPRAVANQLNAFANEVRALKRTRNLATDVADLWLLEVQNILASTEFGIPIRSAHGASPNGGQRARR